MSKTFVAPVLKSRPTFQDILFILPARDRDTIWSAVFAGYTRPRQLRPLNELASTYPRFRCISCHKPDYCISKVRIPLLRINKVITADVQRYLYGRLERIKFCNYICISNYLSSATGWGPLRWAKALEVDDEVSYYDTVVRNGQTLLAATVRFNERVRRLHPDDATSMDWDAQVQKHSWYPVAENGDRPNWRLVLRKR